MPAKYGLFKILVLMAAAFTFTFLSFWWSLTDEYDRYLVTENIEAKTMLALHGDAARQYVQNIDGAYIRMSSKDFLSHKYTIDSMDRCYKAAVKSFFYTVLVSLFFSIFLYLITQFINIYKHGFKFSLWLKKIRYNE